MNSLNASLVKSISARSDETPDVMVEYNSVKEFRLSNLWTLASLFILPFSSLQLHATSDPS